MQHRIMYTVLAAAALMAVAGSLWLTLAPVGRPSAELGPQPTRGTPAAQPVLAASEPNRGLAQRWAGRYALEFSSRVHTAGVQGGKELIQVSAQGQLQLTALPGATGEVWLAGRARGARLQANALALRVSDLGSEQSPLAIDADFAARVDTEGRVLEVRFAPGLPTGIQAMWTGVMRDLQFVVPPASSAGSWKADEANLNAEFTSSYQRQPDGSYAKRWSVATDGEKGKGALFTGQGDGRFAFADGHVRDARMEMSGGGRGLADVEMPRYTAQVSLRWLGPADAAWSRQVKPKQMVAFAGQTRPGREAKVPALPLSEFEAKVEAASAGKKLQDRADKRRHLTAVLRRDASVAQEVRTRLASGQLAEPVERTYIEAMVMADTPATQEAMVSLASDEAIDHRLVLQVLSGSLFFSHPGPAYVGALEQLSQDRQRSQRANASLLTLGAAVRATANDDPAEAERLHRKMLDRATPRILSGQVGIDAPGAMIDLNPADSRERASWLDGLGNAGQPEAASLVAQALQDENEMVRKSAAQALRFMPAKAVKSAMIKAMKQEESIFVREALLLAARYHGPEHQLDLVTKALRGDESEYVRLGAAYTVAVWTMEAPALNQVLQQALAGEKSSKVKESLLNYLQPGRTEPPFVPVGKIAGGQP